VTGDLPAIRELVEDGQTGVVIDGNRPEPVAAAMERLAGDGNLRHHLAASARRHVASEFSLRVAVDRLVRQFQQAAQSHSSGAPCVKPAATTALD
jgi:glycosyltransferase involved in cell wall biosynthesis